MKQYDAVVAGYTCVDLIPDFSKGPRVAQVSDWLVPGKLIEIDGMTFVPGGAVPNTGLAMKKFGKKVLFNGLIGSDAIGLIAEELLRKNDAFEGMVKTDKTGTAFSIVLSPPGIDRIFLESPGCNHIFNIDDIDFQSVADSKLFHFGYPPLLRQFFINQGNLLTRLFAKVQDLGVVTSLDFSLPDPESESGKADWLEIMRNTLPYVDIFTPSIEEVVRIMRPKAYNAIQSALKSDEDMIEAVPVELIMEIGEQIIGLGVNILLIKAGAQGAYLFTGTDAALVARAAAATSDAATTATAATSGTATTTAAAAAAATSGTAATTTADIPVTAATTAATSGTATTTAADIPVTAATTAATSGIAHTAAAAVERNQPDVRWNNRKIRCNAYRAEPGKIINASGAGDTAIAAFLTAILNGDAPEMTLKYASMAGRNSLYCEDMYADLDDWEEMTEAIGSEPGEITELSGLIKKVDD